MQRLKWIRRTLFSAALLLASAIPALAGGVDDFTLTKAMPADAFLVVHTRGHEGQKFLKEQFARVWAEFEKLHLERDVKRILKKSMQDEGHDVEQFDEQWQMVNDLISGVDWSGLGEREYAFSMKLGEPMPEFISLMLPAKDKVQADFDGMAGILQHLAKLGGEQVTLATEGDGANVTHRLSVIGAPFPIVLTVARHGDAIAVGFGTTMVEQSLAMLSGKEGATVASTPNFQAAFKKLPPPADCLTFFDTSKFFTQLRALLSNFEAMAKTQGEGDQDAQKAFALINKLIDGGNLFEYIAATATTDGMKTTSESIAKFRDDAKSRLFYPILFGNPPLKDPLKYVPKDATDFAAMGGINLGEAYKVLIKIIKEDIPEGDQALAEIESLKQTQGIDLEKDVFGWLQGGLTTISQPGPTPYAPGKFALLLPVTDEAAAQAALDKLIAKIQPMTEGESAMLKFSDAEVAGKPFKTLGAPMLMAMSPISSITFGITDKMLMVVSSADFAESVLATGAGKEPNISKSERFQKEGIQPKGEVTSISFQDQTQFGEQLGTMMGMAGLLAMNVRENPVAEGALTMVSKLGRVVRKLDFFLSSASVSYREGDLLITQSVNNYRPSPAAKKPASESENKPE